MTTWMRTLVWFCAVGCLACEQPESSAEESAGEQGQAASFAAPDAPIEPGERVPKRGADETPESLPDPAAAPGLEAAVSRLAQRYAGGWVAASDAFEAQIAPGESSDYQLVLGSAHCYRVLGVGAKSLEDVDLLLFDPNGVQVQQDEGSDRFPVVGLSYPVCPPAPGAYRLQARAVKGEGRLRVQAFHSP